MQKQAPFCTKRTCVQGLKACTFAACINSKLHPISKLHDYMLHIAQTSQRSS